MTTPDNLDPIKPIVDLVPYQQEAQQLRPTDEQSANGAKLFIAKCRDAEKSLDAERKTKTDPLRAQIDAVAAPYKLAIEAFQALREEVTQRLGAYEAKAEAARLELQRKVIEESDRLKAKKELEEKQAREAADAARESGDLLGALKLDAKADKAALAAATATPIVVAAPPKTVTFGDGTSVTARKGKEWFYENGVQKGGKYHRDDKRFDVDDEYWLLDEAKIGQVIRSGGKVRGVRAIATSTPVSRKT